MSTMTRHLAEWEDPDYWEALAHHANTQLAHTPKATYTHALLTRTRNLAADLHHALSVDTGDTPAAGNARQKTLLKATAPRPRKPTE